MYLQKCFVVNESSEENANDLVTSEYAALSQI